MRIVTVVVALLFIAVTAFSGSGIKGNVGYEEPLRETPVDPTIVIHPVPTPTPAELRMMTPLSVGTFTTLSGFYDYQSNGGAVEHIRIDPATGAIHVTYMLAEDSTNLGSSRRVGYAYSTDDGATWSNFNQVRVPARTAGFPSIDLGRGPIDGAAIISDHNDGGAGTQSFTYVDFPAGGGAFAELGATPTLGGDEPIWPYVGCASDGSITVASSRNAGGTDHYTRTTDYTTWAPWTLYPGANQSGGRNPVMANNNGRIGVLLNTSNGTAPTNGNWWLESTDNGATWPTTPDTIYPATREMGGDTLRSYVQCDVVYNGDNPLFAMSELNLTDPVSSAPNIVFWSEATGLTMAVAWNPALYSELNRDQRFHSLPLGWPAIGMSGNSIVLAFQAFQPDTDSRGYNYSDIWFTHSEDAGMTWAAPINLTNTPNLDERYPSMSKWNAAGEANMVWQIKNKSGGYAFPGDADTVRASQVFYKHFVNSAGEDDGIAPQQFKLSQNYPNPFNPSTKISYTVPVASEVRLVVYNTLGQEVATLVNGRREQGTYEVDFSGAKLSSGVYFYTLQAGKFVQTMKMVLLK